MPPYPAATTGAGAGYVPAMSDTVVLRLSVNGEPVARMLAARTTLLELLREQLGLTGTKHGCDLGDCGACTVRVEGRARLACITLAADMDGCAVQTIEGVGTPHEPHPLQDAFLRHGAAQCGYCTPGIVMNLLALLERAPHADEVAVREALGSNLCRCTGYTKILDAAREVFGLTHGSTKGAP